MGKKDLEVKMAPEASWLVVIFVLLAGVASTIGGVIATFSHKAVLQSPLSFFSLR